MKAVAVLKEYMEGFQARNPFFHVFNAVIHVDEATVHLHKNWIPVVRNCKRGMDTQNGLAMALKAMGYGVGKNAINEWRLAERAVLEKICAKHGIEIKPPEASRGYSYSPDDYKNMIQKEQDNIDLIEKVEQGMKSGLSKKDTVLKGVTVEETAKVCKKFKNLVAYVSKAESRRTAARRETRDTKKALHQANRKIAEHSAKVENLHEGLRGAYESLLNMVNATETLMVDDHETGYRVPNLTVKQRCLIEGLFAYAAKQAKDAGFDDIAHEIESGKAILCEDIRNIIEVTDKDIEKILTSWNGNMDSKLRVYELMTDPDRALLRGTEGLLREEFSSVKNNSTSIVAKQDCLCIYKDGAEPKEICWTSVQIGIHKLIEAGRFLSFMEKSANNQLLKDRAAEKEKVATAQRLAQLTNKKIAAPQTARVERVAVPEKMSKKRDEFAVL